MYNVEKAEKLVKDDVKEIFVLLTHLHADHASGLGLFAQWCYLVKHRQPIFVSDVRLRSDIVEDMRATGVDKDFFKFVSIHSDNNLYVFDSLEIKKKEQDVLRKELASCIIKIIPTKHVENLANKCFGFMLNVNGKKIVYTGDTNTLEPFANKLYDVDEFYCDMSWKYKSDAHLYWPEQKKKLLELARKCNIYFMHIDDVELAVKEIDSLPLQLVHIDFKDLV